MLSNRLRLVPHKNYFDYNMSVEARDSMHGHHVWQSIKEALMLLGRHIDHVFLKETNIEQLNLMDRYDQTFLIYNIN